MNQEQTDCYFDKILPHYKAMAENPKVQQINAKTPQSFFCTQWGESFDRGILFVGRATNGWGGGIDPDNLHSVFPDGDHLKWISKGWNNPRHNKDGKKLWAGKRSAFWRLIRKVTEHYHKENWVDHIAWTNLAKCVPSGSGNPSESLWCATLDQNKELMRTDIEMLNPKVVVFITLGWGDAIVRSIVGEKFNSQECTVRTWQIDGRLIVACKRPEGRSEDAIAKSICAAIDGFNGSNI